MKKHLLKEIKDKSIEELHKLLIEYKNELAKIKISEKAGKIKNTMLSMNKRKDIARILTVLHDKEIRE
jgi:ribosomal protein L29